VDSTFGLHPMLILLSGASFDAENRVLFPLTRTFASARCAKA
jgi:hypothetical protein